VLSHNLRSLSDQKGHQAITALYEITVAKKSSSLALFRHARKATLAKVTVDCGVEGKPEGEGWTYLQQTVAMIKTIPNYPHPSITMT
jgi:hypothetical protein